MSKLEDKIEKILKENNLPYMKEVSFNDLKSLKNNLLRFDFIVYIKPSQFIAIEADGQQHFNYVKYFHKNIFNFKKAKEWDRIKNAYCLKKGIPLIRIPYWDYDKITLKSIFSNDNYRVKNKFHNDYLINGGE